MTSYVAQCRKYDKKGNTMNKDNWAAVAMLPEDYKILRNIVSRLREGIHDPEDGDRLNEICERMVHCRKGEVI